MTLENAEQSDNQEQAKKRGFASMDAAKQREIASKGGKAAHKAGKAHTWNAITAAEAGRKGGLARRKSAPKSFAQMQG